MMRKYNLNIISEETAPLDIKDQRILSEVSPMRLAFKYEQKLILKMAGWLFLIFSIYFLFSGLDELNKYWILVLSSFLIGLMILLCAHKFKDKLWILDRNFQNISIPLALRKSSLVKSIYDTKSGYYVQTGGASGVSTIVPVVWHNSKWPFSMHLL